jgi:hypothetical protein
MRRESYFCIEERVALLDAVSMMRVLCVLQHYPSDHGKIVLSSIFKLT